MRALGKTPNDPLLQKMSPLQWRLCYFNVIEDEKETNKRIRDLVDLGIKVFCGSPEEKEKGDETPGPTQVQIGQDPDTRNPDIKYTVPDAHGGGIEIHKVMSTEFDKIVESGGKYQGFEVVEE